MKSEKKAKEQLISELAELRQQIVELEASEAQRKRAEEALRESEERLGAFMDSAPDAFALFDSELNVVEMNKAASEMLPAGIKREDMIGKNILDIAPGLQETGRYDRYVRVIETGEPFFIEDVVPVSEFVGDRHLSVKVFKVGDGLGMITTDITERKRTEERLEKVSTAIESVLNDMLLGEADDAETESRVLDACLAATDSVYGMVGKINEQGNYDTTTYASRVMEDCAFPEALAWELSTGMPIRGIWGWPMLHGEPLLCNDLRAHPDRVGFPKGHVPLDCFLGVPLKRDGKVVGMVAVANKPGGYAEEDKDTLVRLVSVMDVSRQHREALKYAKRTSADLEAAYRELRQAQEELVRKEKLAILGQLAGGVGHELRNPLGVISNAVYYLKTILPDANETTKEYLAIISSEVRNSEKIVSDLLDLSRTKPGEREEVAVSELIAQALNRQSPPEQVKVTTEIAPELPPLFVDPRQIGQVLVNLITNAYDTMSEGGRLTVKAEHEKDMVYLSISDTGCGIPEENMERLFEPLFTTKARGIGLGLAVSKNLAEANGGRVEAESEEGKGSTFTVILPTKEAQA